METGWSQEELGKAIWRPKEEPGGADAKPGEEEPGEAEPGKEEPGEAEPGGDRMEPGMQFHIGFQMGTRRAMKSQGSQGRQASQERLAPQDP